MAIQAAKGHDQSIKAFEAFMYALATHYKGKIRNWEGPNEEHMADWGPRYGIMQKTFYRAVKRADPENVVILGTFDTVEAASLDEAYQYGIKGYFDVMNTHPYTWPKLPEEGGYIDKINALRDVMKKYGDDKPIWVSEIGWSGVAPSMLEYLRSKYPMHRARSISEEDQARALARLYLVSATMPFVERVYMFNMGKGKDHTKESADEIAYMPVFSDWAGGMTRPKPAFFSLKTVIEMLNESTYREKIDVGSRVWAPVFERGSEGIVALWSLDDDVTMALADASKITGIISMAGSQMLVGETLHLSGSPIYLKTRAKDLDQLKTHIREAVLTTRREHAP